MASGKRCTCGERPFMATDVPSEAWPRGWQPIPYAQRCRARRGELQAQLAHVVETCRLKADIAFVVVFGSFARDEIAPWSDIDVLIVRDAPPESHPVDLVADLHRDGALAGDLIGIPTSRYPGDLEATPIGRTILTEGRVVYARST